MNNNFPNLQESVRNNKQIMAATKNQTLRRHKNFNVENLLNVRSKNYEHKSINQTPLWLKLWLQECLKSQHKLCSITSQITIQQRWNGEQETWKIHKTVRGLYVTVTVNFEQSERSNWSITKYEPADKFLARSNGERNSNSNPKSFILNRNAENDVAVWDKFLSAQTTSERSERSDWSHTKYEPADTISARSNSEQSIGGGRKLLSETFFLYSFLCFLSLSFLLIVVPLLEETLKVNIGLCIHIGSEPNPTI